MRVTAVAFASFLFCLAANSAEVATGSNSQAEQAPQSSLNRYSASCKILNNMPQPGCTDEDLCLFKPNVYAHVCKRIEDQRAKERALAEEETAIHSGTRNSDPLFPIEDECNANPKAIGKGAALANVVPFKVEKIEMADPRVPGWNVVGRGARSVEVTLCRFWFKKR